MRKTPLWSWEDEPPDGYIINPDGRLVTATIIQKHSQRRMELPPGFGPPDWRHDPSYFWADEVRRKRLK